ncbi:MAG: hypothetical protein GYA57_13850 [Myxococcales bacterium]|nr:hypothetical protein [Myxococcales bacterium]
MSPAGRRGLAVVLAAVFVGVVIAAVLVLPRLGAVSLAVSVIVLLHVLGYLALGFLLLVLGPRQAARLKLRMARRGRRRAPAAPEVSVGTEPASDSPGSDPADGAGSRPCPDPRCRPTSRMP